MSACGLGDETRGRYGYLFLNVVKGVGGVDGEANEDDVRVGI